MNVLNELARAFITGGPVVKVDEYPSQAGGGETTVELFGLTIYEGVFPSRTETGLGVLSGDRQELIIPKNQLNELRRLYAQDALPDELVPLAERLLFT